MSKPNFDMVWAAFPDHDKYPTLKDLFGWIGGELKNNIDAPGFGPNGNTCAVRLSRALNYGNFPLHSKSAKQLKLHPLIGEDKKAYLFRVSELRTYLLNSLGVKTKTVKKDFLNAFNGERGLIAFRISGWQTATGHMALWDGTSFKEPSHDDYRGQQDDPSTEVNEGTIAEMMLWPL
jgi:hypothetical protein